MSKSTDLVVVERMPGHLRSSHRTAGNWGVYPSNGAERSIVERDEAEAECEGAEYDHIVRDASVSDYARYGYPGMECGQRVRSVGAGFDNESGTLRRVFSALTAEVAWDSGAVTECAAGDLEWEGGR